jgi:hypothetical protein
MKNGQQNCHPDRSEAKWRDLLFYPAVWEMFSERAYPDFLDRNCQKQLTKDILERLWPT